MERAKGTSVEKDENSAGICRFAGEHLFEKKAKGQKKGSAVKPTALPSLLGKERFWLGEN
ncbi:hypothetical protein HMPREF0262_03714 [Clostridium sp. ATCC 29733]|nr:hypothetical protein HMPREF0262_03714 [Clostridium sp. ATCC 29733]